jgi:selenoprotein W-related protein
LAAVIQDEFDVEPELVKGGGGIFDVEANGKMIFSKHVTGRFPEHAEVLSQLEKVAT